jgi:hypothetical protein
MAGQPPKVKHAAPAARAVDAEQPVKPRDLRRIPLLISALAPPPCERRVTFRGGSAAGRGEAANGIPALWQNPPV